MKTYSYCCIFRLLSIPAFYENMRYLFGLGQQQPPQNKGLAISHGHGYGYDLVYTQNYIAKN